MDGKINGQGTLWYADGDRYEGEWRDGKMHGRGTYTYADGDQYEGDWRDDRRHGKGTVVYAAIDGTSCLQLALTITCTLDINITHALHPFNLAIAIHLRVTPRSIVESIWPSHWSHVRSRFSLAFHVFLRCHSYSLSPCFSCLVPLAGTHPSPLHSPTRADT